MLRIAGREVFFVDQRPQARDPGDNLLFLHGFPSCSLDFHRVVDRLAASHRLIVHDHLGFGLSAKPRGEDYSLFAQAERAIALWRELGVESGHVLGHDYGTSVATEILARHETGELPFELTGMTLCNGSIHLEMARLRFSQRLLRTPLVGEAFARLASRAFFRSRMRALWGDPARAATEDLDALFDALTRAGGRRVLTRLIGYLEERTRHTERWIGALERSEVPIHVLWGTEDPVAVKAIAERLAAEIPDARLSWLAGVGHYPMLEAPDRWVDAVLRHLADRGLAG